MTKEEIKELEQNLNLLNKTTLIRLCINKTILCNRLIQEKKELQKQLKTIVLQRKE